MIKVVEFGKDKDGEGDDGVQPREQVQDSGDKE